MKNKLAEEGLQGESIKQRINGYRGLLAWCNADVQETVEAKGG
jgi:hypothetical protein